jgi:hypothetical protein
VSNLVHVFALPLGSIQSCECGVKCTMPPRSRYVYSAVGSHLCDVNTVLSMFRGKSQMRYVSSYSHKCCYWPFPLNVGKT